jgi:hypothetical protein
VDVSDVGGLSIAQSPESAAFDSMPKAAIDTGVVELVLDPKDMPAALMEYAADPTTRPGQRDAAVQETGTVEEVFGILAKPTILTFPITSRGRCGGGFSGAWPCGMTATWPPTCSAFAATMRK